MSNRTPRYVVVEGPIGVGKTSFAQLLASHLNSRLLLEQADNNPFLKSFYESGRKNAFQTQLFFLLSRWQQQEEIRQPDIFQPGVVADYLFAKDRIFAEINLNKAEIELYNKLYDRIVGEIPKPDLVVYLYSPLETLMQRIIKRGNPYESHLSSDYLEQVLEKYQKFFFEYRESPLLMVNTELIDFIEEPRHLALLLNKIEAMKGGVEHYFPSDLVPMMKSKD